jgi:hypothetical protein
VISATADVDRQALPLSGVDVVRFGSGRFLSVVAGIYMVGGAARTTGRSVSLMHAENERKADRR